MNLLTIDGRFGIDGQWLNIDVYVFKIKWLFANKKFENIKDGYLVNFDIHLFNRLNHEI